MQGLQPVTIDLLEPGDWIAAMQEGYLANVARLDAAGQLTAEELANLQQVAALQPLYVYALELGADNGPLADLAGHFMVTQADNNQRDAFLYSPLTGLERIANSTMLRTTLKRRLADPLARDTLLRFMPIEVRESLRSVRSLRMRRVLIEGRVFDHRRRSVLDLRLHNLELLKARLLGLPSLRDVLNAQLAVALEQQFQGLGLSAQTLRVNSYAMTAADDPPALSSTSLADLALKYLAKGEWPGNQMREYLSPTVAFDALQARSPTLDVQMYRLVRETAGGIKDLLLQQLEAWWYLDIHGLSLRVLAVEIMADRFFNELLQARPFSMSSWMQGVCAAKMTGTPVANGGQPGCHCAGRGLSGSIWQACSASLHLLSGQSGSCSVRAAGLSILTMKRPLNGRYWHASRNPAATCPCWRM